MHAFAPQTGLEPVRGGRFPSPNTQPQGGESAPGFWRFYTNVLQRGCFHTNYHEWTINFFGRNNCVRQPFKENSCKYTSKKPHAKKSPSCENVLVRRSICAIKPKWMFNPNVKELVLSCSKDDAKVIPFIDCYSALFPSFPFFTDWFPWVPINSVAFPLPGLSYGLNFSI